MGVRRTKVGADAKHVAYVVAPHAIAVFVVVLGAVLGAAAYYSWELQKEIKALDRANGLLVEVRTWVGCVG